MYVETPERAGSGECERCHRIDVERFRFYRTMVVPDWWSDEAKARRAVVLMEPLCDSCYETADSGLDKQAG